jgi:hypothetical protein
MCLAQPAPVARITSKGGTIAITPSGGQGVVNVETVYGVGGTNLFKVNAPWSNTVTSGSTGTTNTFSLVGTIPATNLPAGQFVAATNGTAAGLVATNGLVVSGGPILVSNSFGGTANREMFFGGLLDWNEAFSTYLDQIYYGTNLVQQLDEYGNLINFGTVTATSFSGNGGGLTNISATVTSNSLNGLNGNGLTNLSTSNLTGTVPVANLPSQTFLMVTNYGVKGDGSTDDTTAMQALWNTPGSCWDLGSNTYLLQEMTITNNVSLLFRGAVLKYATGAANTNIFIREMLNTNINIFGNLELYGGSSFNPSGATNAFHTYMGNMLFSTPTNNLLWNYWNGYGLRHGFQYNTESHGHTDSVTIHGFNGCGLIPLSVNGSSSEGTPKAIIGAVNCYSNLVGFYLEQPFTAGNITNWQTNYVPNAQSPEYTHWSKITCGQNVVGMTFEAANCTLENSDMSGNYINDLEYGGSPNDHHGEVSGCTFNHPTLTPIIMAGISSGETYSHCQIRAMPAGAGITMFNCAGIKFVDCMIDQPFSITNTGVNFFINNLYGGNWSTILGTFGGGLVYYGNRSYTVSGDTDGQSGPVAGSISVTGLTVSLSGFDPSGTIATTSATADGYSDLETVIMGTGVTYPGMEIYGGGSGILLGYDPLGSQEPVVLGGTSTTISNQLILPLPKTVPTGVTVGITAPDGWIPVTVNGTNGSIPWWHNH